MYYGCNFFLPDMGIADVPLCPCFFDFLSGVSGAGISHCDEVQSITYNHFLSPKGINLHAPKVSRFPPVFASRTFQRLTFHLCVRVSAEASARGRLGQGSLIGGPGRAAVSTLFDARLSHQSGDRFSTCAGGVD